MNNLIGVLVGLLLTTAQSNQEIAETPATEVQQQVQQTNNYSHLLGSTIVNGDPNCKTPALHPDQVKQIILDTQTMDLNFVALADAESGLYNISKKRVSSGSSYHYRGIFQMTDQFHKIDDYCNPAEQVKWLERKLNEGANPKNLFPGLYTKLYEK